jgi:aspartate racemase
LSFFAEILTAAARKVELAGADFLPVACNALHKVAAELQAQIAIPLVHIADVAAVEASRAHALSVGLLGSRFVMEQDFYRERFALRGIRVAIPGLAGRIDLDRIIYEELSRGEFLEASKHRVLETIDELVRSGSQAIVLGCTELPLLVNPQDTDARLLDTMAIHVQAAVSGALE